MQVSDESTGQPEQSRPGDWQRLSPWALVFLFLNGLQQFVRQNLYAFAGAGAGFAFVDWLGLRELGLAVIAVILVALVLVLAYHRRFRFRLETDAIRVRCGILEHKELRIRFDRVQNVSLSQPFYLRPFGLVRLSLESPGAADKEVELPGIGRALAEAMRNRIAEYSPEVAVRPRVSESFEAGPAAGTGHSVLFHAAAPALFLHGVAGNQIWVLLGALAGLYGTLERRISPWLADQRWPAELVERFESTAALALALALAGAVLALILGLLLASGLVALVRFHDFRLDREGDRFRAGYGLLDAREKTLKVHKLQGLQLVQTALGRALGRWYLAGRQTGAEVGGRHDSARRFLVPGLDRGSIIPVATGLQPRLAGWPEWQPIAPDLRRVLWLRWSLILIAAAGVLYFLPDVPEIVAGGVIVANLLLLGLIWIRWRWWAWARQGELMLVRRGLLGQRIDVFETARVQHVEVSRNLIQRRRGLATLVLRLPHGESRIPYVRLATARDLANRILFAVETAADHQV